MLTLLYFHAERQWSAGCRWNVVWFSSIARGRVACSLVRWKTGDCLACRLQVSQAIGLETEQGSWIKLDGGHVSFKFQPDLHTSWCPRIHETLLDSVETCDLQTWVWNWCEDGFLVGTRTLYKCTCLKYCAWDIPWYVWTFYQASLARSKWKILETCSHPQS